MGRSPTGRSPWPSGLPSRATATSGGCEDQAVQRAGDGGEGAKFITLWRSVWSKFVPFLDDDVEIRTVICSTNAIKSINAGYRRAVKARGHFPTEPAALQCLHLRTRSLDPTGRGRARWAMRCKPALNAFAITFEGRIVPSNAN